MPIKTTDEPTQSGAVILWSQRPLEDLRHVPVQFPCCGKIELRPIVNLPRYRRARAQHIVCAQCISDRAREHDDPKVRPLCPRCGLRPVRKTCRGPRLWGTTCWTCSTPSYATRAARRATHARREQEQAEREYARYFTDETFKY